MKHTKGPWRVHGGVINSNTREVASIPDFNSKHDLGNAHLIAAAPEMLEALELILRDNRLMNAMEKNQAKAIMYSIGKAKGQ